MILRPGDLFVIQSPSILGSIIRWCANQYMGEAGVYNHAAFVTSSDGIVLESKIRYRYGHLSDYTGCKAFIVRHNDMTEERYQAGFNAVKDDIGCLYPAWRLPLFILGLDQYFKKGAGVCSEQTGKFMAGAGFQNIVYGVSPDDLKAMWVVTIFEGRMTVIFDGILTEGDFVNDRRNAQNRILERTGWKYNCEGYGCLA